MKLVLLDSDVELVKKQMYHYLCIQLITTS